MRSTLVPWATRLLFAHDGALDAEKHETDGEADEGDGEARRRDGRNLRTLARDLRDLNHGRLGGHRARSGAASRARAAFKKKSLVSSVNRRPARLHHTLDTHASP